MLIGIVVLLSAVGGTAWLVGMFGWLWHRVRVLEQRLPAGLDLPRLEEALEEELSVRRTDLARLHERIDFLERLLSERQGVSRLPPGGGPEAGGVE